jgi:hypothetical protein
VSQVFQTFGVSGIQPRFITDIFFDIGFDEFINEVFQEIGVRLPEALQAATEPMQSSQPPP